MSSKGNNSSVDIPNHLSNTTKGSTNTDMRSTAFISAMTSYAIVAFVILVGNLICLVVFLKTRRMRRKPYYLLVSLCVADFLVGVSIIEMVSLACLTSSSNVYSTLQFFAGPASLFVLTAIAIERFIVTVFPIYYYSRSGVGLHVALIGTPWLVASIIIILYILTYIFKVVPLFLFAYSRILIPICLAAIIIAYTTLVLKLKCCPAIQANETNQQRLRDRKLAVTLAIVTLISLVTWSPDGIYVTLLFYCNCGTPYSEDLLVALQWLRYLNSCINFIIYMSRMQDFKRAVMRIFLKNSVGVEPSSLHVQSRSEHAQIPL